MSHNPRSRLIAGSRDSDIIRSYANRTLDNFEAFLRFQTALSFPMPILAFRHVSIHVADFRVMANTMQLFFGDFTPDSRVDRNRFL